MIGDADRDFVSSQSALLWWKTASLGIKWPQFGFPAPIHRRLCLDGTFISAVIVYSSNVLMYGLKLGKQCLIFSFLSLSCAVSFVLPTPYQVRPLPAL